MEKIILDRNCHPVLKERKGLEDFEFAVIDGAEFVVDRQKSKLKLKRDGSFEMKVIGKIKDNEIEDSLQNGPASSIKFENCGIFNVNCDDDFFSGENIMSIIITKVSSVDRIALQSTLITGGDPKGEHGHSFVDFVIKKMLKAVLIFLTLGLFSLFISKRRNGKKFS